MNQSAANPINNLHGFYLRLGSSRSTIMIAEYNPHWPRADSTLNGLGRMNSRRRGDRRDWYWRRSSA